MELIPADRTGLMFVHQVHLALDGRACAYRYYSNLHDLFIVDGLRQPARRRPDRARRRAASARILRLMAREMRIALVGFGHVGRRFAGQLRGPYALPLRARGVRPRVTGIATARHGFAVDPRGINLGRALRLVAKGRSLDPLHRGRPVGDARSFIARVPADVLVELTTLDPRRGQPATDHVRQALGRGMHVVTANKGPVAFALRPLRALAARKGRLFLHEGAVMDGTPVFNLVERCLPGCRILGFRGTLNSTTNLILSRMEEGFTASAALKQAQLLGIAEADARNDLDGWDAAVKGCALANALMGGSVRPTRVRRRGIAGLTALDARRAVRAGMRLRLVVSGTRRKGRLRVTVAPEGIPFGDPLSGSGSYAALVLETDLMGEIGVFERGATVDQTAYALFSDLLRIVESR
jgi:homoserine dehydrogenase